MQIPLLHRLMSGLSFPVENERKEIFKISVKIDMDR